MTAGKKLSIALIILCGAIAYLIYLGSAGNWKYYVTVEECLADYAVLSGNCIRVSGKVAGQSLHVGADRRQAVFMLQGTQGAIAVTYSGTIPDNLAEGVDVVVEGWLEEPVALRSEKILTRCASKYESQRPGAEGSAKASTPSEPVL
jgi:cytochrome c-type biogenesis protein CcmE